MAGPLGVAFAGAVRRLLLTRTVAGIAGLLGIGRLLPRLCITSWFALFGGLSRSRLGTGAIGRIFL